MAILPKEKPKEIKKKKSIETLKKVKPFLEKDSFEYVRKELKKKYENPVWKDIKAAHRMTVDPIKQKAKNIAGGFKHTIDYLRNPKDKKFLGHTDNTKK
tara:strand:+ start:228 stop:524 length:297 start_codon:yes stop_codon:yes gene_type:complete